MESSQIFAKLLRFFILRTLFCLTVDRCVPAMATGTAGAAAGAAALGGRFFLITYQPQNEKGEYNKQNSADNYRSDVIGDP